MAFDPYGGGPTYAYTFTNTWVHVVVWYDGTTMKFYVNNSMVNSGALGPLNTTLTGTGYFGTRSGSDSLPGLIDDIRIYNRALSVAEISLLYNEPAN